MTGETLARARRLATLSPCATRSYWEKTVEVNERLLMEKAYHYLTPSMQEMQTIYFDRMVFGMKVLAQGSFLGVVLT